MLGAIIRSYAHRLSPWGKFDWLLSPSQFEREVLRERIRASRRSIPFCLIFIDVGRTQRVPGEQRALVRLLQYQLRVTDQKGWLSGNQLGILLVDTPEMGGRAVLDRLKMLTEKEGVRVTMSLQVHDPEGFASEDDVLQGRDDDFDGDRGRRSSEEGVVEVTHFSATDSLAIVGGEAKYEGPLVEGVSLRRVVKRGLDVMGASCGIVFGAPVILAAMAAVKLTSRGPAIYTQTREGRYGRPFTIYKLRTMVVNAESIQDRLKARSHRDGPAFKIKNDPRVIPVGRFLRSTCVDELPQLWNVLKGDMSLVGPRPLPWKESRSCRHWHRRRLDVRPGLTCAWQVNKSAAKSFDDWMRMDLRYVDRANLMHDLHLIAKTILVPLRVKGSD